MSLGAYLSAGQCCQQVKWSSSSIGSHVHGPRILGTAVLGILGMADFMYPSHMACAVSMSCSGHHGRLQ